jgi:hypothetical protein
MSILPKLNLDVSKVLFNGKSRTSPLNKYCRFNLSLLITALLPLLLVGLFNISIDPYGVFNSPIFSGLNQAKIKQYNNMRLFKATNITRIKPLTIFLGSSRSEYGLDPRHPVLDSYQPAYNLALAAATPYELLRYLQHTIANQPKLKLVIIGVDEFMFNKLNREGFGFSENRLEKDHLTIEDAINITLSIDAFVASEETISLSRQYPEYQVYTPQGMLNLRPIDKDKSATKYRFRKSLSFYFQTFPKYEFSTEYLNDFKMIIDTCKQHNISVKVFISPSHATRLEAIRTAGQWAMYERMKREIVKIIPVWDFSGYNSVTIEQINDNMKNYIDDSHYRKEIGDLLLNRILSYKEEKVPADFGVFITPDNIESHLAQIRANREEWAKNNLEVVNLVENIKVKGNTP